jgi:hypothetical protein
MTALVERMDTYGKGAWIALMVVSFVVFWPLGLAILGYMMWSGRMGCWSKGKVAGLNSGKFGMDMGGGPGRWYRGGATFKPSGNRAFDEYREETLRRLEDEYEEFQGFLEKLRHARDKAEFDQFMADRAKRADVTDVKDENGKDGGKPAG